ncbi:hypothetical protein Gotur_002570 [Gossypium turneri]
MIGIADPKLWNLGVSLLSKWRIDDCIFEAFASTSSSENS